MPRKKKEESTETAARPKRKASAVKKTALKRSAVKKAVSAKTPKKSPAPKAAKVSRAAAPPKSKAKISWKPPQYGETQVVAFIRDPNCIFVYWEVASQKLAEVQEQLKGEFAKSRILLRMFRDKGNGAAELLYEVEVNPESMNQYLPVEEPGFSYFVEVVRKAVSGKVALIARSNTVSPPGRGLSRVIDSNWMPAGELAQYLSEELEGTETFPVPGPGEVGGVSSAESQRRRAKARETFSSFWSKN
jgi:hypothetical protein